MSTSKSAIARFAIIGCGLIGQKRSLTLPASSLLVVCDVQLARAEKLAQTIGCRAVSQMHDALTDDVDAVIVATTNSTLAPLTELALRAGKHVLVEKPAAISAGQIAVLEELAGKHGLSVRVGYNHRYHAAFQKARQIVDSGALGPLMFIRGRYGHGGRKGYDREWRADPNLSGGGELIDQGVHLIDLAAWFLGDFESVAGHADTYFWDMPVDDNAFLDLRNSAGKTAWLQVSCTEWKNLFSFEIYGRNGKLHIRGLGGSYGVQQLAHYHMLPAMGPPETIIYEYPAADSSWQLEMDEFVIDIRERRTPRPGLREARKTLEVVGKIYNR
jgi:predicted dehydrogenase